MTIVVRRKVVTAAGMASALAFLQAAIVRALLAGEGQPVRGSAQPIGGQAVLEGVMLRGAHSWGLAVRRPLGTIACHSFSLSAAGERHPTLKLPVLRGVVALGESVVLGVRALGLSANLCMEGLEEVQQPGGDGKHKGAKQMGWRELAVSIVIALVVAVALFVLAPLAVATYFGDALSNAILFNVVEGVVRIGIFLAYLLGISLLPDLRRVFQYHGAEHKVIHAYEAGEQVDTAHARRWSTLHPRCGTAFLLVVMVLAILVFSLVGKPGILLLVLSRLVGIPIVAGLSYEIVRYAGKHKDGLVSRVLLWPGLGLQKLTTREPNDDQLEVAVTVLHEVLRVEAGGEPSPCRIGEVAVP